MSLRQIQQKLNDRIARRIYEKHLFFVTAITPGRTLVYGYAPIHAVLCRVVVDIGRPDGIILAQPVPWWQITFLKPEQNVFWTQTRNEFKHFVQTPQGKVPAVTVQEMGIWFKA